jgi:hypothetical protein
MRRRILESFEEALRDIDSFCKVTVKKTAQNLPEADDTTSGKLVAEKSASAKNNVPEHFQAGLVNENITMLPDVEEPLIDIFDEEDHVRILVQCRCREQEVTFHTCADGIRVCREECQMDAYGTKSCQDVCRNINLQTDQLQLDNMLFIVAKCNNNNTLEAMIPKKRQ